MDDPYQILGVARTATEDEIRAAYRKLAKKHHPDLNPGKHEAEEKFKAVSSAYALLSDADKRARFDRGEIDASGAEKPQERRFYRDFGEDAGRAKYRPGAGGALPVPGMPLPLRRKICPSRNPVGIVTSSVDPSGSVRRLTAPFAASRKSTLS